MDDERTVELTKDSQNGGRYNESEVTFIKFVDEKNRRTSSAMVVT